MELILEGLAGRGELGPGASTAISPNLYDPYHYSDPNDAARQFVNLNKEVSKNKITDMQTVRSYLTNVYQGGSESHVVSLKKFVNKLNKMGITIKDRREMRLSNLEKT